MANFTIILFLTVTFLAAVAQGISGFGLGIVLVAFFPLFMSNYTSLLAISALLSVIFLLITAFVVRKNVVWYWIPVPAIGFFFADIIAVELLDNMPILPWTKYLGVVLILLGLYMLFLQKKISIQPSTRNGLIAGGLGGLMGGLFGVPGPPMVLYFLTVANEDKYKYHATLQVFFLITTSVDFIIRVFHGMITQEVLRYGYMGIGCLILGLYLGQKILNCISSDTMRKIICGIMIFDGFVLLI
jgi:hypothetical protein